MRKGLLLSVAEALLLACGTEDLPGPSELHLAFTVQLGFVRLQRLAAASFQ